MNILMLNNEFPPLGGGTATVNYEILKELKNFPDVNVTLITSGTNKEQKIEHFAPNIKIIRVYTKNNSIHHATAYDLIAYAAKALLYCLKLLRKEKFDSCLAWCTVPAGAVAFCLNLIFGLKYFVRISGPDIPGWEERYNKIYPFLKPIFKLIWHKAKKIIVKSENEKQQVEKLVNPEKIVLIPNGVRLEDFTPAKPRQDGEPLKIICVARLIKRKSQDTLIKAAKILLDQGVNFRVTLVGDGDAYNEYLELTKSLGLSDYIKFTGYIPRQEIPKLLSAHHVFVLTSQNESMSNAILEGMASGLAIVASDVSMESSNINKFAKFQSKNHLALAEELIRLYDKIENLESAQEISRLTSKSLSWNKIKAIIINMFNSN